MDCIERQEGFEGEGDGEANKEQSTNSSLSAAAVPHITFLYKLVHGVARRSFGLNVARLAGLPEKVVAAAARHAAALEDGGESENEKIFSSARRVAEAAAAALASGDARALIEAAKAAKEALA